MERIERCIRQRTTPCHYGLLILMIQVLAITVPWIAVVQAFTSPLLHRRYSFPRRASTVRSAELWFALEQQRVKTSSGRWMVVPTANEDDSTAAVASPSTPSDTPPLIIEGEKQFFNGTFDNVVPIMFDPAIAAAASDSVVNTVEHIVDDAMHKTEATSENNQPTWIRNILTSYWGPRIILGAIPAIYGTNFALGSLMNDALPASAVTATRMTLATAALAPFVLQIKPDLAVRAVLTGCFTATGYVAQSIALVDADPARVSFLGSATVLWLPILESVVDKTPMGLKSAPQTWLAAVLCIVGVGILELYNPATGSFSLVDNGFGIADLLALLQAVGFGTGIFLSAKMVREQPSQVVPVTSVLIATTAVLAWIWCIVEGSFGPLQELFASDPMLHLPVIGALVWTGVVSTSLNFVVEIAALGYVPSSEAAVLLATEPIWAAIFAAVLLGETMGVNDYVGGTFIVAACLVNALIKPKDILNLFRPPSSQGVDDVNGVDTNEDSK